MAKEYKSCQSCTIPFENDPNPELRSSNMYCSMCFKDGGFTQPGLTLEEMEKQVIEFASKHTKYPIFLIKQHAKTVKNYERWKNKDK